MDGTISMYWVVSNDKSVGIPLTLLYAMCKGNLPSFLDQLAQISGFTFEL